MSNWENYNKINISGIDLIPSFSIYLIELSRHSTQNQLMKALKNKGIDDSNFENLSITMHHFPIEGYEKQTLTKTMQSEKVKEKRNTK